MNHAKMDLEEQVLPYLKETKVPFEYFRKENEALILLSNKPTFFTFINYIPKGTKTTLPTVEQSINNKSGLSRISEGEWVVEKIYQVEDSSAEIFQKIIKVYK